MKDVLYEDELLSIVIPDKPVAKGHLQIYPKKGVKSFDELSHDEVNDMLQIASRAASVLFEELGSHGTNIIVNEGNINDYLHFNIIARMQDDDLDFQWKTKEVSEADLEQVMKALSTPVKLGDNNAPEVKKQVVDNSEIETMTAEDEDNYLTRRMGKLP